MKRSDIKVLAKEDILDLIDKQWMLVTAGTKDSFNTMTASWGTMGVLWNKPVAIIFIRPERYTHDFIETADALTLSFYSEEYRNALKVCGSRSGRDCDKVAETGLTPEILESGTVTFSQARLTLDCTKLFKTEMTDADFVDKSLLEKFYGEKGGMHTVYILGIDNVYVAE